MRLMRRMAAAIIPVVLAAAAWAAPAADPREQGLAEAKAGRWHLAVAPLEQVIRTNPGAADAEVWRTLARAYLRQSRTGDAVDAADRGLKALGDDAWLLQTKSDALGRMRRADEAADAARRAEKLQWKGAAPAGKTPVIPPFSGSWRVIAGPGDGAHAGLAARWAWDFAKVNEAGLEQDPKARDKRKNESYFAWDQPVLAPADGEVVFVESGVPDNILSGTSNDRFPLGNHLVIRHASGELSYLGHLKKGSVTVKAGDTVKTGEAIARSGNSGAIVQPQIHYALLAQWDPALCVAAAFTVTPGGAGIQPKKAQLVTGAVAGAIAAPGGAAVSSTLAGAAASSTLAAAAGSATTIIVADEKKEKSRTKTGDEKPAADGGGVSVGAPPIPPPAAAIGGAAALGAGAGALSGLLKGGGGSAKPDAPSQPPEKPADTKPGNPENSNSNRPETDKGNNAAQEGQQAGQQGDPGTNAPSQQANANAQQNVGQQGQQAGQQAGQQGGQQAGQQAGHGANAAPK